MGARSLSGLVDAAPLFAALGDGTRLKIVAKLSHEGPQSIAELSEVADVSRQAITKHLGALAEVGMVSSERVGRERRFTIVPGRLDEARRHLDTISAQWDQTLERLRAMVED